MKAIKKAQSKINEDHKFLESLGFSIVGNYKVCIEDSLTVYDLSAVKMEVSAIICYISKKSYDFGYEQGATDLRNNVKSLLGVEV